MEYSIASFTGPHYKLKEIIEQLTNEVTHAIRNGAILVGGFSIISSDIGFIVSQAYTIEKNIVNDLISS